MRQDVTGFFTMLQGDRARGVRGFRPRRGVCGDSGPGAGWGGDSDSGRGVGIRAPGARWDGDSGPGRGVGIRARARGGSFWGVRWEIFYLFAVFSPFR